MKTTLRSIVAASAILFLMIASTVALMAQAPGQQQPANQPTQGGVVSTSPFANPSGGILEPPAGGVLDGVYVPEHLKNRKPMPYTYQREADVIWSKRIWRVIDLREKINHPYYYPTEDQDKRPSLFKVLQSGIMSGKITSVFTFDPYTYEFGPLLTIPEMAKGMTTMIDQKDSVGNPLFDAFGNQVQKPDTFKADDIVQYMIKEDWFFDKQRSVMDVRILAICPFYESDDPINGKFSYKPLFWIYYPGIRNYLSQFYCYNPYNDGEWRSFDEMFHKRLFNSYVYMESNVYNRSINSYLAGQGMEQLLESERIKDDIFKFEHDMWHF